MIVGKKIGSGAFGYILGEPRLPDTQENLEQVLKLKQVCKVFGHNDECDREYNNIDYIINNISKNVNLKDYLVLPIKKCTINKYYVDKILFKMEKSQNRKFIYHKDNNKMIVYPKGNTDLYDLIKYVYSFNDFFIIIKKLFNILQGIECLLNNKIIHFDIKLNNILLINDKFKIIDLSELSFLSDKYKYNLDHQSILYYCWNPLILYYYYLDQDIQQINVNNEYIKKILKSNDFNRKQSTYIYKTFILSFDIIDLGFSMNEISQVLEIRDMILEQKILREYSEDIRYYKIYNLMELINIDRDSIWRSFFYSDEIIYIDKFLNKFNKYFEELRQKEGKDQVKQNILKRLDLYSFGVVLMEVIKNIIQYYREMNFQFNKSNKVIIMQLYNIIFLCCYQKLEMPNIEEIINQYNKLFV
jgi:serine/threonine protein kinase